MHGKIYRNGKEQLHPSLQSCVKLCKSQGENSNGTVSKNMSAPMQWKVPRLEIETKTVFLYNPNYENHQKRNTRNASDPASHHLLLW